MLEGVIDLIREIATLLNITKPTFHAVKMLFTHYDIDGNGLLDINEYKKMVDDFLDEIEEVCYRVLIYVIR